MRPIFTQASLNDLCKPNRLIVLCLHPLLRFAYFCENREISKNRHVTGALAKQQIDVAQVQQLLGAIQSQIAWCST
jgi:hypothetical protein